MGIEGAVTPSKPDNFKRKTRMGLAAVSTALALVSVGTGSSTSEAPISLKVGSVALTSESGGPLQPENCGVIWERPCRDPKGSETGTFDPLCETRPGEAKPAFDTEGNDLNLCVPLDWAAFTPSPGPFYPLTQDQ